MSRSPLSALVVLAALGLAACAPTRPAGPAAPAGAATTPTASSTSSAERAPRTGIALLPADAFWSNLEALCGQAFEGEITTPLGPTDTTFAGKRLVMHVRECSDSVIRVPFHVGEDRSRTWVFTRTTSGGLRLKHDHRHADGSEDEVTQYGGDTAEPGTATRQEFPADAFTAGLIPAAATNVWTVEVEPGQFYGYGLRRIGTDRRFRVQFDFSRPVEPPPAPWGFED